MTGDWTPPTTTPRTKTGPASPAHPITGEDPDSRTHKDAVERSRREAEERIQMRQARKDAAEEERVWFAINKNKGQCRSENCKADMVWTTHVDRGTKMPLNFLAEREPGSGQYSIERRDGKLVAVHITKEDQERGIIGRTSHFATCPDRQRHRRSDR